MTDQSATPKFQTGRKIKTMKIKLLILSSLLLCLTQNSFAAELETHKQKYSYAIGIQIAQFLIAQDIRDVEEQAFAAGVADFLAKKQPQLSQEEMQAALKKFYADAKAAREELAKENLAKGEEYRAENAKRDGVTVLKNGLQYEVLTPGDGEHPKAEDKVEVHYTGKLIDGTVFDSSYERGKPAQFNLNGVVPGFREAITRMLPGGKWHVVMPPELAYGEKGAGKKIGPNETLTFEIEYIGTVAAAQPPKPTK
jgi:FKBP-type peptidyl-prolyl cis-trans isomerase FklB